MESEIKAEFTVEGDTWNTLWLVQKVINEGEKAKVPVKIEIRSGSVESTVQIVSNLATIGSFMVAIAAYLALKRKRDRPLKMVKVTRDTAYAIAWQHLQKSADVRSFKLVRERPSDFGDYNFVFVDNLGKEHIYTITRNLEVRYARQL